MSGIVFKGCYPNDVFVKLTCKDEIHNGYKYKTGINRDFRIFNPTGECSSGGFYFINKVDIKRWLSYNWKIMVWMRSVKIPDDAMVYCESGNKFKCDKFILGERIYLYHDSRYQYDLVKLNGFGLKYILVPHYEVKKKAVKRTPEAIQFVENPILELQKIAVLEDGLCIRFIKNPSEEICEFAVRQNSKAIRYINNPSEKLCKIVINKSPENIRYIKD